MARDEAVNIAVFDTAYREFKSLRASQLIFFWRCDFTDVYLLVSVVTPIIVVTLIIPDEVGLEIDHIIPVSKGGKTTPDNLQVLCSKCNRRKSNKI